MGEYGEKCKENVKRRRILSFDVLAWVSKPYPFCQIGGGCVEK